MHPRQSGPLFLRPLPRLARSAARYVVLGAVVAGLAVAQGGSVVHAGRKPAVSVASARRAVDPKPSADKEKARRKEYQVKAALLFKFIQYTSFPKTAFDGKKAPIELMVVGKDPFGDLLEAAFKSKKLHGRTIRIRRVAKVPKALDAHLVFAAGLDEKQRTLLIERSAERPVLLVGEAEGFAEAGAFINFYKKGRKLRFEVRTDRQKDTGLKLKAELLKLARIVKTGKPIPKPVKDEAKSGGKGK